MFLLTFSITMFIHCIEAFERDSLYAPIWSKFCKTIFNFNFAVWKVTRDFGHLHSSFLNLSSWTICMPPVTIYQWFRSVNGDVMQLQGNLFILSKMFLVPNVFINSLWLNILDCIVLDNVYTAEICSVLLNCVGKFFFIFLSFCY